MRRRASSSHPSRKLTPTHTHHPKPAHLRPGGPLPLGDPLHVHLHAQATQEAPQWGREGRRRSSSSSSKQEEPQGRVMNANKQRVGYTAARIKRREKKQKQMRAQKPKKWNARTCSDMAWAGKRKGKERETTTAGEADSQKCAHDALCRPRAETRHGSKHSCGPGTASLSFLPVEITSSLGVEVVLLLCGVLGFSF